MVSKHWKQWQKEGPKQQSQQVLTTVPATPQRPPLKQQNDDDSEFDEKAHKRISYAVKAQGNTFTQYYVGDPVEDFKLLDWKEQEKNQLLLVQFALNHALPISIFECERSFSSAKLTLNPLRSYMKSDLFEALETLRAWYLQAEQETDTNNAERA
jgi:hAT family C-terminal dimerisation region